MLRRTSLLLFVAAAGACASLDAVPVGTCGNLVVEDGEQCDGPPADGSGFSCGDSGLGACRYQCGAPVVGADGATAASVCPEGYACSLNDHICRPESLASDGVSLSYSSLPIGLAATAQSLAFGDFNGDGVGDLFVVNDNLKELYLGSSTGFTKTFSSQVDIRGDVLPVCLGPSPYEAANPDNPSGHPLSTSLYSPPSASGDGPAPDTTTDLLFLSAEGPSVMTGNSDGTPTPVAYPALAVPGDLRFVGFAQGYYLDTDVGDELPPPVPFILVTASSVGDSSCHGVVLARPAVDGDDTVETHGIVVLGCLEAVSDLSHIVHLESQLMGGATDAACPTMIIGTTDGAYVYDPCTLNAAAEATLRYDPGDVAPLPTGTPVAGPFPFDVDGDGQLDLLTALADGHFQQSKFDVLGGTTTSPYAVFTTDLGHGAPMRTLSTPLAVGDINGDGFPDWVTADGVYLSVPCACFDPTSMDSDCMAWAMDNACVNHERVAQVLDVADAIADIGVPAGSYIDSAVIGDMTGDGRPDVAISVESPDGQKQPFVVVLQFAGSEDGAPFINVHAISVPLPASNLVVGDFNGDGLADVGFAQTDTVNAQSSVSVVFGDPAADFSAIEMGAITGVVEVQATNSRGYEGYLDGVEDLGVIGLSPEGGNIPIASTVIVLAGEEGHVLLGALGLVQPKGGGKSLYRATALATTAGFFGGTQRSLVAIGGELKSDGSSMTGAQLELWSAPLTGDAALGGELERAIITTPGADSAFPIAFDPTVAPSAVMATGRFTGQSNDSAVALVTYTPSMSAPMTELYRVDYTPGNPPTIAKLADVAAAESPPLMPPNAAARVAVAQLFDPADGGPDVVVLTADGALSRFVVPTAGGAATAQLIASDVRDFALLPRAGEDAQFDVVYTSMPAGSATVDVVRQPDFTPTSLLAIDNLTGAIAAGDMNGDRLPDIAVATTEGVKVYLMNAP